MGPIPETGTVPGDLAGMPNLRATEHRATTFMSCHEAPSDVLRWRLKLSREAAVTWLKDDGVQQSP